MCQPPTKHHATNAIDITSKASTNVLLPTMIAGDDKCAEWDGLEARASSAAEVSTEGG